MVLGARPVARDTATMPPWPAARASDAASNRRLRSSRCGDKDANRARIKAGSTITSDYDIDPLTGVLIADQFCYIFAGPKPQGYQAESSI